MREKTTKDIEKILDKYCVDCKKVNLDFIIKKIKERLL